MALIERQKLEAEDVLPMQAAERAKKCFLFLVTLTFDPDI